MSDQAILTARGIGKVFVDGKRQVEVLNGVDLTIGRGEFVAIVGSSGSGKSTLLHVLGGLDLPSSGTVEVMGEALSGMDETARGELRNRHLGFVYQFHHLLPEFTALENVSMPLLLRDGVSVSEAASAATTLLERVGLGHRLDHKPPELSGGERQRVALARALVTRPALVLADEPTGNLDAETSNEIQALLRELREEFGMSLVIVTHDPAAIARCTRCLRIIDGRIAASFEGEADTG